MKHSQIEVTWNGEPIPKDVWEAMGEAGLILNGTWEPVVINNAVVYVPFGAPITSWKELEDAFKDD